MRILDLGVGGKQETKKKSQKKVWNQQRHISQMTSAWKPTQGTAMRGKRFDHCIIPAPYLHVAVNSPPPLIKKIKEKQLENKRVEGGGAGFSTGIHYHPTTDIKLV